MKYLLIVFSTKKKIKLIEIQKNANKNLVFASFNK